MINKLIAVRIGLSILVIIIAYSPFEKISWIGNRSMLVKSISGIIIAVIFIWTHFNL
jgi:hypothetical protein